MATSAALDRTNLYTQSFWNFFNLINNRSNVIDPKDAQGGRKFVYAHEPNLGRGFDGYPLIFMNPANVVRDEMQTADDLNAQISGTAVIEIRSTDAFFRDNTAADPHGKGLTWIDQISDDIIQTFNSQSNRNTLRENNIGFVRLTSGNVDYVPVNGETVYIREFTINFKCPLLTVST